MNHMHGKISFTCRRALVLVLALLFSMTSLITTPSTARAAEFSGQGFEVEFIIGTIWSNGYTARIILTNTSDQPIRNWALRVDANLGVENREWGIAGGGRITAQDDSHTLITHHGWNSTLAAGASMTLYIANGTHTGQPPAPTAFVLTGTGFESGTNGGATPPPAPEEPEDEDEEDDEDADEPDESLEEEEEDEDENGEEGDDPDENGEDDTDDETSENENDEQDDEDKEDDEGDYDDENGSEYENGDDGDDSDADDADGTHYDEDGEEVAHAAMLMPTHDGPQVLINGTPLFFDGQPPTVISGRTLVPVRAVFEALDFSVDWYNPTRTVTLVGHGYILSIAIGSDVFYVNGAPNQLDIPAQIINGSTMLPIRLLLESVGFEVDWDQELSAVLITR